MRAKDFHPEEVLFSPTTECNLSCGHCGVKRRGRALAAGSAVRFLRGCKRLGVKRVGFTGGEPFLEQRFMREVVREAVRQGLWFGRVMTNAVWWRDEGSLESALTGLSDAGYDGSICVSADAFHRQDIDKVARFIAVAVKVWRRPDVVSVAYVSGARDAGTKAILRALKARVKRECPEAFLKTLKVEISPIGRAAKLADPWKGRWFREDYCRGPGNAFFILPDGAVKPCCGYATDRRELTIGNIGKDSAADIISNARKNRFVSAVFSRGLVNIRKALEGAGVRFPGRSASHCFFCNYILTKVPRRVLMKCLASMCAAVMILCQSAPAQDLKIRDQCRKIPSRVVRQVKVPKWYHEGLFYDGKSLWLANGEAGDIWVIDPGAGLITSSIKPVADFSEALIKADDGRLFTTDWNTNRVYRVKLEEGALVPDAESSLEPAHPAGLAWAGGRLFIVAWLRGMGTRFYLVEMDSELKETARTLIRDIQEPDQLAWDGQSLWISSWYEKRVYRVDIDKLDITGYFASPVSKTTGIAWDGRYMWVTGTYGDLYQMEIGGQEGSYA